MLIKSIWLEVVEFILPKGLYSPTKVTYTICLINEGNFLITHTMMFIILKMSLFDACSTEFPLMKPQWTDL